MPYSEKIKKANANAPDSLGAELGQWAVARDLSMQRIALIVGASRQTIYNWFTGATDVTPSYQERVQQVIAILKKTSQTDDVWRLLCKTFNIKL